jgi:hypothetical protein
LPNNSKPETLSEQWIDSSEPAEPNRLAYAIQDEVFSHAPYVPLVQYAPLAARRKTVTVYRKGPVAMFRNVVKA